MEQINTTETNQTYSNQPSNTQPVVNTTPVVNTAQPVQTLQSSSTTYRKSGAETAAQVVGLIFGLIIVLLGLRILFLLLGGRSTGFASFLYTITTPFVAPFQGIFAAPSAGGSYFDTAALLAMVIWGLVAWGIVALIQTLDKRTL